MAASSTAPRTASRKERRAARDRGRRPVYRWLLGGLLVALVAALVWRFWFEGTSRRIAELSQRAHAARQDRDYAQVARLTREWGERAPYDALPFVMQAEALQAQGDLPAAAAVLEQLPDTDPRTPQALLELSHLYFGDVNKPLSGVRTCERVIRIALSGLLSEHDGLAAASEANRRLVFFYGVTRQRNKLLAACRAAIAGGYDLPETYVYYFLADRLQLTNAVAVSSAWARSAEADEQIFVGLALARLAEQEGADPDNVNVTDPTVKAAVTADEAVYLAALQRFPANPELLNHRLYAAMLAGNSAELVQFLQQAPSDAASDSRFWRYRGWYLAQVDRLDEAVAAYQKALELFPFDWTARHQLADVVRRQGREATVEDLEEVSVEGKNLQKLLLQLPDVRSASSDVLLRMAAHFRATGEMFAADCLESRL